MPKNKYLKAGERLNLPLDKYLKAVERQKSKKINILRLNNVLISL
jgi:hypothetical protein